MASTTCNRPAADWREVAKHPLVRKLIECHNTYCSVKAAHHRNIGEAVAKLLKTFAEPKVKEIVQKVLRLKQQTATTYIKYGRLYNEIPNDALWHAVGWKGIAMLHATKSAAVRRTVIASALKLSRELETNPKIGTPYIGDCWVQQTLTRAGEAEAAKLLSCTANKPVKVKLTDAAMRAALEDLRAFLMRRPPFAGEFDAKTLSTLDKLSGQ